MTTVKQLKEWLNRFPDDTEVEFAKQQKAPMWESFGPVEFVDPKLDDEWDGGWEFFDFRNNQFVKPGHKMFGKTVLQLGTKD